MSQTGRQRLDGERSCPAIIGGQPLGSQEEASPSQVSGQDSHGLKEDCTHLETSPYGPVMSLVAREQADGMGQRDMEAEGPRRAG